MSLLQANWGLFPVLITSIEPTLCSWPDQVVCSLPKLVGATLRSFGSAAAYSMMHEGCLSRKPVRVANQGSITLCAITVNQQVGEGVVHSQQAKALR
jgi:hypothetical protein